MRPGIWERFQILWDPPMAGAQRSFLLPQIMPKIIEVRVIVIVMAMLGMREERKQTGTAEIIKRRKGIARCVQHAVARLLPQSEPPSPHC